MSKEVNEFYENVIFLSPSVPSASLRSVRTLQTCSICFFENFNITTMSLR